MNAKQIQKFVMRYLESTGCQIIEKHPAYVTVKLSPAADKVLTNRSYYWSFVERTGAEPETMTFTFVFDPEKLREETETSGKTASGRGAPAVLGPSGQPLPAAGGSILERYFGVASPAGRGAYGPGRIPREEVTFGSRRLLQLFDVVRANGKYVQLFEEPDISVRKAPGSSPYRTYLGLNVKVELACDLKRDELHSFGVDLENGELYEQFYSRLSGIKLSPRLPPNIYTARPAVTLAKARTIVEQHIVKMLKQYDHSWADEAHERLLGELERVDSYYSDILAGMEGDSNAQQEARAQWEKRRNEIEWQHKPRIHVTVVNCGLFHLRRLPPAQIDVSR